MRSRTTSRVLCFGALWMSLALSLYAQTPQIGQNLASLVYLDGRNVIENAQFNLQRDQLLSLETYDLLPNSTVELSTSQASGGSTKKVYQTNEKGAMKDILFFPKARSTIRCVIQFKAINGESKRIVFHLRPV
jgi:hypothetical protein